MNTLGERLFYARETARLARGEPALTQEEVALKAGVSQSTIGNIEAGIRQRPRELLRIAAAVGVSPEWLSTGAGAMEGGGPPPMEWPFELFTREQWLALSERQRGVVESAALRAMHALPAAASDAPAAVAAHSIAAAFEALPPEHQRSMYATMMSALHDPETHLAMMTKLAPATPPSDGLPTAPRTPRKAGRAGLPAKRTRGAGKAGRA